MKENSAHFVCGKGDMAVGEQFGSKEIAESVVFFVERED